MKMQSFSPTYDITHAWTLSQYVECHVLYPHLIGLYKYLSTFLSVAHPTEDVIEWSIVLT